MANICSYDYENYELVKKDIADGLITEIKDLRKAMRKLLAHIGKLLNDIQKTELLLLLEKTLRNSNRVSIEFTEDVAKDIKSNTRLELTYSYLGNIALSPSELINFIETAKQLLLPLLVIGDDKLPTFDLHKSSEENNDRLNLVLKLKVVNFIRRVTNNPNFNADKWEVIKQELDNINPWRSTKTWMELLVFKNLDIALSNVASKYISIPTGYINVFTDSKVYKWNFLNQMLRSWTSEDEDLDDLTLVSEFLPLVFSQIPYYTVKYERGKWKPHAIESKTIDFRAFVNGLNALRKTLLYDSAADRDLTKALYSIKENVEESINIIKFKLLSPNSLDDATISNFRQKDYTGFDAFYSFLKAIDTGGIFENNDFIKECIYLFIPSTCDASFLSYVPDIEKQLKYVASELASTTSKYAILDFLSALRMRHSANRRLIPLSFKKLDDAKKFEIKLSPNLSVLVDRSKTVTFLFSEKLKDFNDPEIINVICDHLCIDKSVQNLELLLSLRKNVIIDIFTEVISNHILNDLVLLLGTLFTAKDFGITVKDLNDFKNRLDNIGTEFLYKVEGDKEPKLFTPTSSKKLWLVEPTSTALYHQLLQFAPILVQLLGNSESSVVLDSLRKQLNKQKLSQQGGFVEENIYLQTLDKANPNSHTFLKDSYRGTVLMRDAKSKTGEVKKIVEFSRHEHFFSSFLLDYFDKLKSPSNEITIHGPVVSDKPYIPGIKLALSDELKNALLNNEVKVDGKTQNSIAYLKSLVNEQLGIFYKNLLVKVNLEIGKINEEINTINKEIKQLTGDEKLTIKPLNTLSGENLVISDSTIISESSVLIEPFKAFNESIESLLSNTQINPKGLKHKDFIKDLFLKFTAHNRSIQLIDNFIGYYNKDGWFVPNPILLYNLNRYDINGLWYDESADLFISDLIKDNVSVYDLFLFLCKIKSNTNEKWEIKNKKNLQLSKFYLEFTNVVRFLEDAIEYYKSPNDNLLTELKLILSKFKKGLINNSGYSISKLIEVLNSKEYAAVLNAYQEYQDFKQKQGEKSYESYKQRLQENETPLSKHAYYLDEKKVGIKSLLPKKNTKSLNNYTIEFNPILVKYNMFLHLVVDSYLNASVGTYLTHPLKGYTIAEMLKGCIGALVKRNVILSATVHLYLTNRLDTILSDVKCMVIPNLSNQVFNILGDGIDANGNPQNLLSDDGCTYVDPAFSYLENNSLKLNKVGGIKKQFGSHVNSSTGTGMILKTSGQPLTNDWIRNSQIRLNLVRKMRSLPFNELLPSGLYIDFTQNQRTGKPINWENLNIYKAVPSFDNNGVLQHAYYKLKKFTQQLGSHTCTLTWDRVDEFGVSITSKTPEDLEPVTFNNLFDFWSNALGGMYSCKFENDPETNERRLTYNNCDRSNELLADMCCYIGVDRDNYDRKPYSIKDLILKQALIGYSATIEAMKNGATNINTVDVYYDPDYKVSYFTFKAHNLGVQLDAEHSAFETRVSLMTQVINALIAKGYSTQKANLVYDALYRITRLTVNDVLGTSGATEESLNKLASLLLDVIGSTKVEKGNTFDTLSVKFREAVRTNTDVYEQLKKYIPIDDPLILRLILSKLTVSIQQNGVRLKLPGGQYVLTPSDNFVKLYNGKLLSDYGGVLSANVISYLESLTEKVPLSYLGNGDLAVAQILLGHTYIIKTATEKETFILDTPQDYYDFRKKLKQLESEGIEYAIHEDYTRGNELGCEDFIVLKEGASKNTDVYHIWDLYEVRRQWELCKQLKKASSEEEKQLIRKDLVENQVELLKLLNRLNNPEEDAIIYIGELDESGNLIKSGPIHFDRNVTKYVPFLAIMPKYLKERFGLTDFDTFSDIKNNPNFFTKRIYNLLRSLLTKNPNADLCVAGKKTLFLTKVSSIQETTLLYTIIDGDCWYLDAVGNKLFKIPVDSNNKPLVKITLLPTGEYNVETTDLEFFALDPSYSLVYPIPKTTNKDQIKKDLGDNIINYLAEEDGDFDALLSELNDIQKSTFQDLFQNLRHLRKLGDRIYTSFLDSLKFIASRTPAQCHQSFMAMECVGFNHVDTNEALVSRWLLWLLGSDFDIKQC